MPNLPRPVAVVATATLLLAISACARTDTPAADSAQVAAIRSEADSIAMQMATELSSTATRTGTWKEGDASSEWTARMQGDRAVVIEERVRFGESGNASRAFFYDADGALEEFSEQRAQRVSYPDRSPAMQLTETSISFREPRTARRTVDGRPTDVPAYEIDNIRSHAAELAVAARKATVPVPP